jgi:hypothetical protein
MPIYVQAHEFTKFRTSAQGAGHELGHTIFDEDGRKFRYVHFKSSADEGVPYGFIYSGTDLKVTKTAASVTVPSIEGGTTRVPAGIGVISGGGAGCYGWLQVGGLGLVDVRCKSATFSGARLACFISTGKLTEATLVTTGTVVTTQTGAFVTTFAAASGTGVSKRVLAGKYWIGPAGLTL